MTHSQVSAAGGDEVEARGRWGGWLGRHQPAEGCSRGSEGREVGEGAVPELEGVSVEGRDRGRGGQGDRDCGEGDQQGGHVRGQGGHVRGQGAHEHGLEELANKGVPAHQDSGQLCSVSIKNIC